MSPKKQAAVSEWKTVTREMSFRRGHGPWLQVRIKDAEGNQTLWIMRKVAKHRELGEKEEVAL